jgi:hypothetical protein
MHFTGRWFGRDGPILWPPRSPDITPLDFFLWECCMTPVTSLDESKIRIFAAIETITPEVLQKTWREVEYRLDIFRAKKGAHVEVI